MSSPSFWQKACDDLSQKDKVLAKLISKYQGDILVTRGEAFETLFRSIVGQQISVSAAQSVWNRLSAAVSVHQPQALLKVEPETLKSCGLSARKVEYARDLAGHFVERKLRPENWENLEDEEIISQLMEVRGIGRWTAEMFLIFHLLRPNVFPKADLGLQKAISIHYRKKYPMSDRQLEIFRKKYSPWASVATWYLWRALDPIPVAY